MAQRENEEFFDAGETGDVTSGEAQTPGVKRQRVYSPGSERGEREDDGEETEVRVGLREVRDVREGVSEMSKALKLVLERLSSVEEGFKRVEEQLKEEKEESRKLREEVRTLKSEKEVAEARVEALEFRIIDQEARGRRNNLIFHGLEESREENCVEVVKKFIRDKSRVPDSLIIERAHRLGPVKSDRTRPMIVRFLDFNDKNRVKQAKRDLYGRVYVTDDLPTEIREARALLVPKMKAARLDGNEAWITYPARLIVNGHQVESIRPSCTRVATNEGSQQGHPQEGGAGQAELPGGGG